MKERVLGKGLAVSVILLFLGVAVYPAIAINPISSDNEEDCDICPKVSKTQLERLKSLINRAELLNNKLSVMSKHNPEVAEKYQELSDRITILPESINRESICTILAIILGPLLILLYPAVILLERLEDKSMPLLSLITIIYWFSVVIFAVLPGYLFLFVFRCHELIEFP